MNIDKADGRSRHLAPAGRYPLLLAAGALILTAPRLLFHEMFRDEAWLWLVAIESRSLPDLFTGLNRSGQGYLFPMLCWLASKVSTLPQAMQAVNLAIVGATVYSIERWAPLRPLERALLVLGYYFFYEYAVISRHYALGVLLACLACVAVRRANVVGLGGALGLLCQTTVYGYILALALAAGFLLQRWSRRHELPSLSPRAVFFGGLLAMSGAIAGLVQLVPEAGTSFAVGWRLGWDPVQALATLQMPWHAFFPLPKLQLEFWNSDLLAAWPVYQSLAGAAALALATVILWPQKLAIATFGLGGLGLLFFGYTKYIGTMRHHGHWWLLFIAAIWIAGGLGGAQLRRNYRERLLLGLLVLQCAAMVFASWVDFRYPFSNGTRTAAFIRAHGLDQFPLLGYREPPAASVALALGKPMYSPSHGVFVTHTDWGPLQRDLDITELRCSARTLAKKENQDIVLVVNSELPPWAEIQLEGSLSGAILNTENYFVYRLRQTALVESSQEAACIGEQQAASISKN